MKKPFIILTIFSLVIAGTIMRVSAQTSEKKLSYNLINEYGFFFGGNGSNDGDLGVSGIFVNSVKFNNSNNLLGIGVGYEISVTSGQSIPLFLNFRHCFDINRKVTPFLNVAAGTLFNYWNFRDYTEPLTGTPYASFHGFGIYSTLASGFQAGSFSLSTGFFFKSRPKDDYNLYGGIEIKAGYTF